MLAATEAKAKTAGLELQLVHGNAENTGFEDESFDLVTASLLFHETPQRSPKPSSKNAFDCCKRGTGDDPRWQSKNPASGRMVDANFEEPYIQAYAVGSLDAWLGAAGFAAIRTEDWWGLHQISCGVKPLQNNSVRVEDNALPAETFLDHLNGHKLS
jgi:hypothetical protein